ncbi:MAG TPA: hypothetical protein PK948_03840 [Gemmatimonadales bacterium]|nr:hypothetical protein [Gemmatimonadales bacterium]
MPLELPRRPIPVALLAGLLACSGGDDGTGPGPVALTCSPGPAPTVLAPGEFRVVDPAASEGCLRLPPAGVDGAEYLIAALSTAGQETPSGVTVDYALQGATPPATPVAEPLALSSSPAMGAGRLTDADRFHQALRVRERQLAAEAGGHAGVARLRRVPIPPVVGLKDTFTVCANSDCSGFSTVVATARYVGPKGAIFLDDLVPAGGFTQADIDILGGLFDGGASGAAPNMYQIDTMAFGGESDIDDNGRVIFLLTDAVNNLSGSCIDGSIILGFFYGGDLLPRSAINPGSNEAEVFYGLVPSSSGGCAVSKSFVVQQIAPVFIHEFQHMISFNQHVLIRGSAEGEQVWLNEGLSHFAEELGGRLLGNGPGQGQASSRLVQFAIGDILNANEYLMNPESHFLVMPRSSTATLEERGAAWLFVRWLADHYAADSNGTSLTRQLVGTTLLGAANVEAATGSTMSLLVPLWQMANYLDNLPGFTPADPRLAYPSWDFRHIYDTLHVQRPDLVLRTYPLRPDSTVTGTYGRTGTLRAGSGRHLRILQPANAASVDVMLARRTGDPFPDDRAVRFGLVRIR